MSSIPTAANADYIPLHMLSATLDRWFSPRNMSRIHRFFIRMNKIISGIYTVAITSLILGVSYIYVTMLGPVIHVMVPWYANLMHSSLSLYLIFSVAANYFLCLTTAPSDSPSTVVRTSTNDAAPNDEKDIEAATSYTDASSSTATSSTPYTILTRGQAWRVCLDCDAPKPPRTHHCSTCNKCYMRMCHHCPALGRCVARNNYPYFFRFIWAAFVGCIVLACTSAWLMARVNDARGEGARLTKDDGATLFTLMVCGGAVALSTGMLALWHAYLAGTAQTTIEWLENWRVRRRGDAPPQWGWCGGPFTKDVRSNTRDSFGMPPLSWLPWWSVVLFPFPRDAKWN